MDSLIMLLNKKGSGGPPPPADPGSVDPDNIVLLLNGDVGLDATKWENQKGSDEMTFRAPVVYTEDGLNGHGIISFPGGHAAAWGTGWMTTPVLVLSSGSYTCYYVVQHDSLIGNKRIWDDGVVASRYYASQAVISPVLTGSSITGVQPVVGKWCIYVVTINGNSPNSRFYTYEEDAGVRVESTGSFTMSQNIQGITLGGGTTNYSQANCNWAYVIHRQGADSDETRDEIVAKIRERFAI